MLHVLATLILFAAVAVATHLAVTSFLPALGRRFRTQQAVYAEQLGDLFVASERARWIVTWRWFAPVAFALVVVVLSGSPVFALSAGAVAFAAPVFYLRYKAKKQEEKLEEQIHDLIGSVTATTKAGMTLRQSLEEAAAKLPAPVRNEMRIVTERIRAGQTVERALRAADERIGQAGYSLFFRALMVNERRGGRLSATLDTLRVSLKEFARVEQRVKTETSGIKLSSRIMAAMPIFMGAMLYLISPEHILVLFDTVLGNVVLVVAALMDYVGFRLIQRISEVEV